mmetsp:Transcript_61627/g.161400  ORF Transcript_61627/g.161400 Transcript_61627/m.161400 type:complete len:92 (+) Transcript_61627:1044-1319(+)
MASNISLVAIRRHRVSNSSSSSGGMVVVNAEKLLVPTMRFEGVSDQFHTLRHNSSDLNMADISGPALHEAKLDSTSMPSSGSNRRADVRHP